MIPIFPANALTKRITATTTASASEALPAQGGALRVHNIGSEIVYFALSTGVAVATVPTGTAVATCCSVGAGDDVVFSIPPNTSLNISAITETGTTAISISVAEGI
jgi:hypothetical protein